MNGDNGGTKPGNHVESTHDRNQQHDALKFKWTQQVPQYGEKLLQRLNGFRKTNMFYDVTLKTTDGDLAAHKVVLAACGGMFRLHIKNPSYLALVEVTSGSNLMVIRMKGLTRSYFVNPKTKMIDNDVSHVDISCPSNGLLVILKFAYSGVLEITQDNLLPTLLAANSTDMKEVQEICVDLSSSKISWLLSFNGTEESLNLTADDSDKRICPETVQQAFSFLHDLLKNNSVHFPVDAKSQANAGEDDSEPEDSESTYPCLPAVQERWPEWTFAYTAIIDCLRSAKVLPICKQENEKQTTKQPSNVDEIKFEKSEGAADIKDSSPSEKESALEENAKDAASVENSQTEKAPVLKPHAKERSHVPTSQKTYENRSNSSEVVGDVKPIEEVKKPVTKPRSATAPYHRRTTSDEKPRKSRPPSPPKDSPLSRPRPASQTFVTAPSPTPTKRKPAAPKPPGPPPPPASKSATPAKPDPPKIARTPSAPPRIGKAPPPRPPAKVPPPRPKPPSVSRKSIGETRPTSASIEYDDALNPFAIEEEDEDIEEDKTEAAKRDDVSGAVKDDDASHKTSADDTDAPGNKDADYDSSLNPFG